jgi:hypothetical protein
MDTQIANLFNQLSTAAATKGGKKVKKAPKKAVSVKDQQRKAETKKYSARSKESLLTSAYNHGIKINEKTITKAELVKKLVNYRLKSGYTLGLFGGK